MCNACHNMCCGSDQFGGCGCDHCDNEACWPDDIDDEPDEYEYDCAPAHHCHHPVPSMLATRATGGGE